MSISPLRAAVLFVNYGPYHVARARALLKVRDVDATFVELASVEQKYAWSVDKRELGDRLVTAMNRPYEGCAPSEMAKAVCDVLERIRPQVVAIAGYSEPGMRAAADWARTHGAGVVLMGDSVEWGYRRRLWVELPKRWWIRRHADAGFVAGTASREYMVKLGVPGDRVWQPYDVVDNDFFARETDLVRANAEANRSRLKLPRRYFLFIGRLVEEKNLPNLLRAYAQYRENVADPWSLVLVGDGPMREELLLLAKRTGDKGIVWAGAKAHAETPSYFALAEALILASRRETWGLVVNEGMASGLPVLVSKKCGCSIDLVREGENGFTFAPEVATIAHTLARFAELPAEKRQQMGAVSRELIRDYSPEAWATNLHHALKSTVKARDMNEAALASAGMRDHG